MKNHPLAPWRLWLPSITCEKGKIGKISHQTYYAVQFRREATSTDYFALSFIPPFYNN